MARCIIPYTQRSKTHKQILDQHTDRREVSNCRVVLEHNSSETLLQYNEQSHSEIPYGNDKNINNCRVVLEPISSETLSQYTVQSHLEIPYDIYKSIDGCRVVLCSIALFVLKSSFDKCSLWLL